MAAQKKSISPLKKKFVVHRNLEKPVHNLIGYSILLVLAVITLVVIFSMQGRA